MMAARMRSAAVLRHDDPRAAGAARVIPANADVHKVGDCVLGYSKAPIVRENRVARQRFTLVEMAARGYRKTLRELVRSRRDDGIVIDDFAAWATVAADIAAAIFGVGMTLRNIEGQLAFMGLEVDKETLAPIAARAAQWRRARDYRPLSGDEIGRLVRLSWSEREALGITRIGSFDETPSQRRQRHDRVRKAAARAEARATNRLPPWEALGISKATYYRRRETDSVRSSSKEGNADKNSLTPGVADGFRLTLRPNGAGSPLPMGNADKNSLTGTLGGGK